MRRYGSQPRHKFSAKPVTEAGIRFDSKKEHRYWQELKLRVQAREVVFFLRQTPIHLPGGTKLVIDFLEFWEDGTVHFIDVKGYETTEFKIKRREVEALYPFTIEVVK